ENLGRVTCPHRRARHPFRGLPGTARTGTAGMVALEDDRCAAFHCRALPHHRPRLLAAGSRAPGRLATLRPPRRLRSPSNSGQLTLTTRKWAQVRMALT